MARYRAEYDGERRTEKVTVQLAPSEKQFLVQQAAHTGASPSAYVRELCLRRRATGPVVAGTTRNPAAKQLADELRSIGVNLNQMSKVANQTGALAHKDALDRTLDAIKAAVAKVINL